MDFGAKGDGAFDNSSAFAAAFASTGALIKVPAGTWVTGPITLKSDSVLYLDKDAVIKFIADENLYSPVFTRWEGVRCYAMHPCVYAENAENVKVTGEGTIDGNGSWWWTKARSKKNSTNGPETPAEKALAALNPDYLNQPGGGGGRQTQFLRPSLVQFNSCKKVELSGVTVKDSPFWTVNPVFCQGVSIVGVTISNPEDSPNTDAIDIDSCEDVYIANCDISVGDDAITIKSGSGEDAVKAARPTKNVVVENCVVHSGHGGAVIGSETAAGISNVTFRHCTFIGTDRGIRIKTRRGRGGHIENLNFSDLTVEGCLCPIAFNMFYRCGTNEDWPFVQEKLPVTDVTPSIRNVTIEDVKATNCRSSATFMAGLPEAPITGVKIKNCTFGIGGKLESTDLSEMFRGIPHVDYRGVRTINAEVKMENVVVTYAEDAQ